MSAKYAGKEETGVLKVSGQVSSVPIPLQNVSFGLGLVLLLWKCEFERFQDFVAIVDGVDRAPDDAEDCRELRRACPRVAAVDGVQKDRGHRRVGRPFEPRIRLVESE